MGSGTLLNQVYDGSKIGGFYATNNISSFSGSAFTTNSLAFNEYAVVGFRFYPYQLFGVSERCIDKIEVHYKVYGRYGSTLTSTKGTSFIGNYINGYALTTYHTEGISKYASSKSEYTDSISSSEIAYEGSGADLRALVVLGAANVDSSNATFFFSDIYFNIYYTINDYTITTRVTPEGAGIVVGGGSYASGAVTTLTATPADGYVFNKWSDWITDNPRTVTVTDNATYTAEFNAVTVESTSNYNLYIGNKRVSKIYVGNRLVSKAYIGTVPIFTTAPSQLSVRYYVEGVLKKTVIVEPGSLVVYDGYTPLKSGYLFKKWDANTTNVTSNMDTSAIFVSESDAIKQCQFSADMVTSYNGTDTEAVIPRTDGAGNAITIIYGYFSISSSVTSITIPNSITFIGKGAFSGCTNLQHVYYTGTTSQWHAMEWGGASSPQFVSNVIVHTADGALSY